MDEMTDTERAWWTGAHGGTAPREPRLRAAWAAGRQVARRACFLSARRALDDRRRQGYEPRQ